MRKTIESWWPWIGWTAVLIAYPFELGLVTATGAAIGTVGYVLRIDSVLRTVRSSTNT